MSHECQCQTFVAVWALMSTIKVGRMYHFCVPGSRHSLLVPLPAGLRYQSLIEFGAGARSLSRLAPLMECQSHNNRSSQTQGAMGGPTCLHQRTIHRHTQTHTA